jgi:hypothetical protein
MRKEPIREGRCADFGKKLTFPDFLSLWSSSGNIGAKYPLNPVRSGFNL